MLSVSPVVSPIQIQLPEPPEPGRDAEVFGFHVHLRGPHEETEVVPGRGGENFCETMAQTMVWMVMLEENLRSLDGLRWFY